LFNKKAKEVEKEIAIVRNPEFKNWQFPELNLLDQR
jgi:hypothetical protein